MYTRISKSGGRSYLQLVEGHRDPEGKVRIKVVANLGRLDRLSPEKLDPLINGFRVLKTDIEIAPVHHRLPDRIRAHPLICFLALTLHRVIRMRLKAKGHHASPQVALDILSRIQKHTAYAGSRSFRGISNTTPEQLDLFETLNLPKPA